MADYDDRRYHCVAGMIELGGIIFGVSAGFYFGKEIGQTIADNCPGLAKCINNAPVVSRVSIAGAATYIGYIGGKLVGNIAAYSRKRDDLKKKQNEAKDARTEWLEQIQKRAANERSKK